jgi:hypothetical protein
MKKNENEKKQKSEAEKEVTGQGLEQAEMSGKEQETGAKKKVLFPKVPYVRRVEKITRRNNEKSNRKD